MPRVEFYEASVSDLEAVLCRLVERAYRSGERVYVWTAAETQARRIDELLWTFTEESFVPHGLWQGEAVDPVEVDPIAIGWLRGNPNGADCLCLARNAAPKEVAGFSRIMDLVPSDDRTLKEAARSRYRSFREAGFEVFYHPKKG